MQHEEVQELCKHGCGQLAGAGNIAYNLSIDVAVAAVRESSENACCMSCHLKSQYLQTWRQFRMMAHGGKCARTMAAASSRPELVRPCCGPLAYIIL